MNQSERQKRNERIAEIAKELLEGADGHNHDYMCAGVVKAVDDARRAEYYERLEALGQVPQRLGARDV